MSVSAEHSYEHFLCFYQDRGVGRGVLREGADACERAHPGPAGAAVSRPCSVCGYVHRRRATQLSPRLYRWEPSSQSLRLHLLQLRNLNRSIVRDGFKV